MHKIPIVSDKVKQLIELENKEPFPKIFTPLTNQPTNCYLKKIMTDLNINKIMTFHRVRIHLEPLLQREALEIVSQNV